MAIIPTVMEQVRRDGKSVTGSRRVQLMQLEQSSHVDMKQHTKYSDFQMLTELKMLQYQG